MTKKKSEYCRKKLRINPRRFSIFLCTILFTIVTGLILFIYSSEHSKNAAAIGDQDNLILSEKKQNDKQYTNYTDQQVQTENTYESFDENVIKTTEEDIKKDGNKDDGEKTEKTLEVAKDSNVAFLNAENVYKHDGRKIVYLTFDDGPTGNITPRVLDVLKKYDVKATFFIIGKLAETYPDVIKRQVKEGHAIGNHTYSHVYKEVYASKDSFLNELKKSDQVFKNILGNEFSTSLFRFPGGSFEDYKQPMKDILNENRYIYIDWNTVNGDEEITAPTSEWLFNRVKETAGAKEKLVVLMHDSGNKETTLQSLPNVIEYFRDNGYEFGSLK